jgi:ComF family protein
VRLKHVWAATDYDGFAKRLVQAFKYERAQAAAAIIASSMRAALPYLAGALVVHVPTATSRVRSRGYDHTGLLARALAKQLNLESAPALARLGQSRQVGSKRKQRHLQLSSAFRVKNSSKIAGRHILLVDDIVTTGSTLEAAANALKAGGAKTVDAVVFAQSQ